MLSPKRVKFRKMFKGRTNGIATRGATVAFGHYGLQALEPGWVTARQIEAARVDLTTTPQRARQRGNPDFPRRPGNKTPRRTRPAASLTLRRPSAYRDWLAPAVPGRLCIKSS